MKATSKFFFHGADKMNASSYKKHLIEDVKEKLYKLFPDYYDKYRETFYLSLQFSLDGQVATVLNEFSSGGMQVSDFIPLSLGEDKVTTILALYAYKIFIEIEDYI